MIAVGDLGGILRWVGLVGGPVPPLRRLVSADALLGEVALEAGDAYAVAKGAAFGEEPAVVVGQVRHSTHAVPLMIFSQPGLPGIF